MAASALPVAGGTVIGDPYQGTHAVAFNQAGGSDNWESENAVDIAVPIGTPVYAVTAGTIGPQFGSLGSGGRFAGLRLHLNGTDGDSFYYAHLSSFAPNIRPGVTVKAGELLGYSGEANGVAHLHFATTTNTSPLTWIKGLPTKVADALGGAPPAPTAGAAAAGGQSSSAAPSAVTTLANAGGCATVALLFAVAVAPIAWVVIRL